MKASGELAAKYFGLAVEKGRLVEAAASISFMNLDNIPRLQVALLRGP